MIFSALSNWPAAALRIAAAQVARRQHRLHAGVPQHRLRRQAHLREQPLRAAAREIEHRLGLGGGRLRVADDRDVVLVLDVEQRARRLLRQAARQLLVDEVDHLLLDRRRAERGRRRARSACCARPRSRSLARRCALKPTSTIAAAHQLDGLRVGRVEHQHRRRVAGPEALLPHLAQQVAHVHRHVAEVDLHRARRLRHLWQTVQWSATSSNSSQCLMRDAAARLLLVQEGLDQQRGGEDLVARAVQQVGARHVRRAHRLALAAAQAVLDAVGDGADVALLHDQRLVAHQAEARRVGVGQVGVDATCAESACAWRSSLPLLKRPSGSTRCL